MTINDHRELIDILQLVRQLLRNQQYCKHTLCRDCNYTRQQILELLEFVLDEQPVVVKAATHDDYLGG